MKAKVSSRCTKVYGTDVLMKHIWKNLVRDFRTVEGHDYNVRAEQALDTSIKSFREFVWPTRSGVSPSLYKKELQLQNLFKRYKFANDLFTESELQTAANEKFAATQARIAGPLPSTQAIFVWLQETRKICKEILGPYGGDEELELYCKFGKKASVGNPKRDSYLDKKLSGPITGSFGQIKWFTSYLQKHENYLIADVIKESGGSLTLCESLNLTNVAKSYKALRSIMPNTLIGGFRTYGLGKMIQKRLKDHGLNITNLQRKHGEMVREFSITRSHVTADLSAASDSFRWELIVKLLPRDWYTQLALGRIRYCFVDGRSVTLTSFMTMGVGFTFPLQTLLFYALLKSMAKLMKVKGKISVYGDDLIYPRQLHRFVLHFFPQIGLNLNVDKTFVNDYFRESCGSDFYRGVNVRPYQPEGETSALSGKPYVLMLYKILNGLLRRWDKCEISITYRYLISEILRVDTTIYQVPMYFPDYSGLRVDVPVRVDIEIPFDRLTYDTQLHACKFNFYKMHARERIVTNQYAYYWDSLRQGAMGITDIQNKEYDSLYEDILDSTNITWVKSQPKRYVQDIHGKWVRVLTPTVARKASPSTIICQTGSTSRWAEEG